MRSHLNVGLKRDVNMSITGCFVVRRPGLRGGKEMWKNVKKMSGYLLTKRGLAIFFLSNLECFFGLGDCW